MSQTVQKSCYTLPHFMKFALESVYKLASNVIPFKVMLLLQALENIYEIIIINIFFPRL